MKHLALPVSDQARSRRFYETYFGFDAQPARNYDDGVLMLYNAEGFSLALKPTAEPIRVPSFLHFGVQLPSAEAVRAFRARLAADDIPIVEEWDEREYVSVKCLDPDGYIVEAGWEPNHFLDPVAAELLAAHDRQLRAWVPDALPAGEVFESDGPLLRFSGGPGGGWVLYRDLAGLEGAALDELIARQVRFFAERGERFEWKYYGHDLPPDLPERLLAAGFVSEPTETVVIARVADVAAEPRVPPEVSLREVTARADFERIAAMERRVWGDDHAWLPDTLASEREVDPNSLTIVVAEAGDMVVCAAWIRYAAETEFAALFGGATLAEWRRRGIYRATVAYRANLARQRGFRYLEVDASDDSRPILERLGFVPVTTTTPYIWSPR